MAESRHGLIVAFGFWVFGALRWLTFTHFWRQLPASTGGRFWNPVYKKSTPEWKDLGEIIMALLTLLTTILCVYDVLPRGVIVSASAYILFDIMITHVNLLWFDSLVDPARIETRVWSHLRILFESFIGFGESIVLFGVLYLYELGVPSLRLFWESSLLFSFSTAMTFNYEGSFLPPNAVQSNMVHFYWSVQTAISLFYVLLVITILANQGYVRKEITDGEFESQKASQG